MYGVLAGATRIASRLGAMRLRKAYKENHLFYLSKQIRAAALLLGVFVVALSSSGCAIKLAPQYDQSLVAGLSKLNDDAMVHFASVSKGGSKAGYVTRKATYDSLIGQADALRIQSAARPAPNPLFLSSVTGSDVSRLEAPTTGILEKVVQTLTRMRDRDGDKGISAKLVILFKNSFETSMDQALTYEKALQR